MNHFVAVVCFLGFVLSGSAAGAADGSEKEKESVLLEDVVVTAQKGEDLLQVPADISCITAQEIQERGHSSLVGFLKNVAGLHVSMDAGGTNFSVRGQKVNMGAGVMIYIDGRRAVYSGGTGNGTSQSHKLDDLPVELIDKIEVIKAPAASIYGGGAAHGIIHIHTKKAKAGRERIYGNVAASYGSWGTRKANLSLHKDSQKIDYSAMVQAQQIDGYREKDKKNYVAEVNAGFRFDPENRIGLTLGINETEQKYPASFQLKSDMEKNRRSGRVRVPARPGFGGRPGKPAGYQYPTESDSSLFYGDMNYQGRAGDVGINSALHLSHLEEDILKPGIVYDDNTVGAKETNDRSNDIFEYNLTLKKSILERGALKDTVSTGADYEYFKYDNKNNKSKSTTVKTTSKQYGLFVNNDFSYGKFSLLSGLRFDRQDWDLKNAHPDSYGGQHEKVSWDLAPSYRVNENMTLFYSVGRSYWFPSAFHLSMPSWFEGSQNAPTPEGQVPEKNLTHELGIKHAFSKYLHYNISVYQTASRNKYVPSYDGKKESFGGFTGYKPAGNSTSKGVELEVNGNLFDWWAYRGSVAWTDSTWDKGTKGEAGRTDLSGKRLTGVPVWTYSAGMTFFPIQNLSLAIDMKHERKSYADDQNKTVEASYLSYDAKLVYSPLEKFSLHLTCANLFDRHYDKKSGSFYDPRPGRYMEAGLTYRF